MKKVLLSILAMAVSIFAAEKVYMAPVSLVGMHSDYGVIASKLMKAYIEDDGRYILVVGTEQDSVSIDNQSSIRQKAISLGCSKYITAEFTRLGENVLTSFKLYGTDSDAPVWDDRLKAKNPDDFDPIIQRVARNIGTKNKATRDDDIYSVTKQETVARTRKPVTAYWGLSINGALTFQPEVDVLAGLSTFLLYDADIMLFSIDGSIYGFDETLNMGSLNIAGYYPFGSRAIAPYVGLGLGLSFTEYNSKVETPRSSSYYYYDDEYYDEQSGLTGFIGGGVIINRNSKLMFNVNLRYFMNFYKNKIYETEHKANGDLQIISKTHAANGLVMGIGLAYGF